MQNKCVGTAYLGLLKIPCIVNPELFSIQNLHICISSNRVKVKCLHFERLCHFATQKI